MFKDKGKKIINIFQLKIVILTAVIIAVYCIELVARAILLTVTLRLIFFFLFQILYTSSRAKIYKLEKRKHAKIEIHHNQTPAKSFARSRENDSTG